jgi:hypothetical protein
MLDIFDRMVDTPAQVMNHLGETLTRNDLSLSLLGDRTGHTGLARFPAYRWFTDPASRLIRPAAEHTASGRTIAAQLRAACTADRADPRAGAFIGALVGALLSASEEFAGIWREHPVAGPYCAPKHIEHPRPGRLELSGQRLGWSTPTVRRRWWSSRPRPAARAGGNSGPAPPRVTGRTTGRAPRGAGRPGRCDRMTPYGEDAPTVTFSDHRQILDVCAGRSPHRGSEWYPVPSGGTDEDVDQRSRDRGG